jgi:hypothetical protein
MRLSPLAACALALGAVLGAAPRAAAQGPTPPAAFRAATDSLLAATRRTWATPAAIAGGIAGAVAGGVAFAHFTHRAGGVNNVWGTAGGAVVGAGLFGGAGALLGLLVGSGIPR